MTENEAIAKFKRTSVLWESTTNTEIVEAVKVAINALSEIQQYKAIGTVEELKELKDYKELYDVYRNIGSIDEFRKLKNKKNVLPIASIIINEEDMQKIVDEKIKEIELDIQKIRAKAIDDFAETIKTSQEAHLWYCSDYVLEFCNGDNCEECSHEFTKQIDKIAEQMKAGGKNE